MALSVQIPKEILDYKPRTAFGFTNRQFISILFLILITGISTLFYVKFKFSSDLIAYIIIILGLPVIAYGFFKPHNYPIEEYIKIVIAHNNNSRQRFNSNYKKTSIKKSKKDVPENYECIISIDKKGQKKRFKKRYKQAKKEYRQAKKIQQRRLRLEKKESKKTFR